MGTAVVSISTSGNEDDMSNSSIKGTGPTFPVPMDEASSAGLTPEHVKQTYAHVSTTWEELNWCDPAEAKMTPFAIEVRESKYRVLAHGVEWLLEPLLGRQPRSHAAFFSWGRPTLLLGESMWIHPQYGPLYASDLFLSVRDRLLQIERSADDEGYGEKMKFDEWLSLPDAIARSWLWRAKSWRVPRILPAGPQGFQQMISTTTEGIDDLAQSYGLPKKDRAVLLNNLKTRFPDIAPARSGSRWKLRCFLDTRPVGVSGPVGDQLLTRMSQRGGTVYRIRNGDIASLHALDDAVEAIDCYHEHLLLKRPGEFDFSPWARSLS
jgi:hypothetical protein